MDIHETEEYSKALNRVMGWKKRLATADKSEVTQISQEMREFFGLMKQTNPRLYEVFSSNDKELSDIIHKKLTGAEE
jgi:hypothetical protein